MNIEEKILVDLGETITIPMNIIVSQNNVFNYLKKFGDQNWQKLILSFLVLEQSKITIMILALDNIRK